MWSAHILTLFPELFPGPLACSVIGRALKNNIWFLNAINIRNYATDKHKTVDDTPYGGGSGMVMRPDILGEAIEDNFLKNNHEIVYLSPRGQTFNQSMASTFAKQGGINIVCGRFEGIDERVINEYRIREVSLGDFVLSSGDIAVFPFLDACVRLLPEVLGNSNSVQQESFSGEHEFLLEYPHFTKPRIWKGRPVPDVLLSGNHEAISDWKIEQAQCITKNVRPDLWDNYLSKKNEFVREIQSKADRKTKC